jgi:small-conductance mechanosensitive channel
MKKTPVYIWLLILFLTVLVSVIANTLLFTLGLILIEFLLYPLALGITALLTGLTAVWLSNKLIHDGLQTPVGTVVRWCEGTAVLLSLLLILGNVMGWLPHPPVLVSSGAALILALVATYLASQLRQTVPVDQPATRRIAAWLIIAFLAIPLVIFVASLFGWAGA